MNLEEIKQVFDRDGFVVLRGYLSSGELEELRERTEHCLLKVAHVEGHQGVAKNLNRADRWFADMLERGKHVALISALLDDELEPATAAWFDRIPGETSGIRPHIDAVEHRRAGATMWIALDHADRENGCLYYVEGTHRQRLPAKVGLEGFDEDSEGAVAVEAAPGDAIVHSTRTVHWSGANRSQRPRQAVSFFYWAASSPGEAASSREDTAGSRVRGG